MIQNTTRRGLLKGFAALAAGAAALAATRALPELPQTAEPAPAPPPGLKPGHYPGEAGVSEYNTGQKVDQLECMGYGPDLEALDDLRFCHSVDLRPEILQRLKGRTHV